MFAAVVAAGLAIWVVWKFGGFDLMATVADGNGRTYEVVNTFATVDHPFHATRGHLLLESLRNGEPLRWVGSHHGGYPVEFYPIGIAWIDVLFWALTFGAFPVVAVHKLTVLAIFVLPVVGFWLLARGDRLNPFVPVLALAVHVATPGLWTSGGLIELVEWGLVANVGGATLAFIGIAALARYVGEGKRWQAVLAAIMLAVAMYANSRSGIPIAVSTLGMFIAVAGERYSPVGERPAPRIGAFLALRRIALVGVVSGLLAAPLLLAMMRYQDYYYFVNYREYTDASQYWSETLDAISKPMVAVAIAGGVLALAVARLRLMRMMTVVLILYAALTVALSGDTLEGGIIQQLETPRLMPFQRLVLVYLAAATIGWVVTQAVRFAPKWQSSPVSAALTVGAVVALASYPGEIGTVPEERITSAVPTTGVLETAEFSAIVAEADEVVPPGRAIYLIGDQESWWHEQLWAPVHADAPFYYDDWMWYWHEEVPGPCNANAGHFHPQPAQTLNAEFLRDKGIGAVVVTNMGPNATCGTEDPRHAAQDNPALRHEATIGYWDLYTVVDPGAIVTNGDTQPVESSVDNGHFEATFENAAGTIQVRHNWFPRWVAWADGERVEVRESADGFMELDVPEGTRQVELRYGVTTLDWVGRTAVVLGLLALLAYGAGAGDRLMRRLRTEPAERPAVPA